MKVGLLLLRTVVGVLFMGHGLQKLAGWFGGYGLDATGQAFEGMGLRPGKVQAAVAGGAEAGGGALLVTGLATPLAATLIAGTMTTAIETVHLKNGPWVTDNGFEYNLVLIAAVSAIAAAGPGALSLDGGKRTGGLWALGAVGAGVIGGLAVPRVSAIVAPAPAPESDAAAA